MGITIFAKMLFTNCKEKGIIFKILIIYMLIVLQILGYASYFGSIFCIFFFQKIR